MINAVLAAALLAATASPGVEGETRRLTAAQTFTLAQAAEKSGQLEIAEKAYSALSGDRDPDIRNHARYNLAKLLISAGRRSDAAMLLRRILDDRPQATPVRFALAQLLASVGDEQSALRELRAVQSDKLPIEAARLVDRFANALRARQPMGASFEFAIAPDSNINRATRSDTIGTLLGPFDIDEDGKARPGTGLALKAQAYRRVGLNSAASLLARVTASADLYRQSEFNDLSLDFAAGPELRLGRNRVRMELGAARRWAGQKPFQDHVRVAASLARPLDRRTQVSLDGSVALIDNHFNDLQDGRAFSGRIAVERALTPTTGIGLSLAADRQALKDPAYSTRGWRGGLLGWKEIGRMTVTVEAEYGRLSADERLLLFPEKRSESWRRVTLGATMRQLTVAGFAPVARLTYERNRSTIEFYDYRRVRAEWGFNRAF